MMSRLVSVPVAVVISTTASWLSELVPFSLRTVHAILCSSWMKQATFSVGMWVAMCEKQVVVALSLAELCGFTCVLLKPPSGHSLSVSSLSSSHSKC